MAYVMTYLFGREQNLNRAVTPKHSEILASILICIVMVHLTATSVVAQLVENQPLWRYSVGDLTEDMVISADGQYVEAARADDRLNVLNRDNRLPVRATRQRAKGL